jgi:hypothetical protein
MGNVASGGATQNDAHAIVQQPASAERAKRLRPTARWVQLRGDRWFARMKGGGPYMPLGRDLDASDREGAEARARSLRETLRTATPAERRALPVAKEWLDYAMGRLGEDTELGFLAELLDRGDLDLLGGLLFELRHLSWGADDTNRDARTLAMVEVAHVVASRLTHGRFLRERVERVVDHMRGKLEPARLPANVVSLDDARAQRKRDGR